MTCMTHYTEKLTQYPAKHDTGEYIESFNPSNNRLLAKVPSLGVSHLEQTVTEAQQAFYEWRKIPAPKRAELVRLIGEELRKNKDDLGRLVSCLLYTSPSPRDRQKSRMPSSA